jgi:hypothetical protein
MKRLPVVLLIFILTGVAGLFAGTGFLSRQGRDILDRNGEKIVLRGFGLGGWLVPEGYQLHIPGFGSPSSIRAKIFDLVGESETEAFFDLYRTNYVAEADIRTISEWGFNHIRLPFDYKLLTPADQPGVFLEEGFRIIDRLLEWCEKYHLYLILDMHCAPGGQNKDNISDSDGIEARLWTEPSNQDRTIAIWRKIAERYANEEWIGGYDILNEPVLPQHISGNDLRLLYMRVTQAIREVDTNHLIFIEGNWYATDFSALIPPWDAKLVYSFHRYWNENSHATIQSYLNIRNAYNYPLWLGESGENSNTWFYDCVRLMEDNDIGWCWWTHKKVETLTSPFSAPIPESYRKILDYWNGTGARPSPEEARQGLEKLARNLALDSCQFRPGVLDALLRESYGYRARAFLNHSIPGEIEAVNYDLGRNGVAYLDNDFHKVHGLQSDEPWNRGYAYRNDGVDIEQKSGEDGSPWCVGWIETGEWLAYTVFVDEGGQYDITVQAASAQAGGSFLLLLDGQFLAGPVAVPSTGGWQEWQDIVVPPVTLPADTHFIEIRVMNGGFNLSRLRFVLRTAVDEHGELNGKEPGSVRMAQNFPNPFNHKTRIPLILKDARTVKVSVYTVLGERIRTLADRRLEAGCQELMWDGRDEQGAVLPSGLYLYTLEQEGERISRAMIFQK